MNLREIQKEWKRYSHIRESGRIEEAIEGYKKLLPEVEKHNFSQVPEMIGVSYRMLDKPQEGLSFAQMAIEWAIKSGDKEQEANARRDLGGLYSDLERYEEAEKEYQKSLHLLWEENEGKINAIAGTLSFMARLAVKKEDFARAHALSEAAITMIFPVTIENPEGAGQYYLFILHKAELYQAEGKKKQALKLAKEALEGFKKVNQKVRIERAGKLIKQLEEELKS